MFTIADLARDYDAQPYEIAAALDIKHTSDNAEITEYTETEAREILDILTAMSADRDN